MKSVGVSDFGSWHSRKGYHFGALSFGLDWRIIIISRCASRNSNCYTEIFQSLVKALLVMVRSSSS